MRHNDQYVDHPQPEAGGKDLLQEALDDIDAALGSDPNYDDGPRLHRKARLALSLIESALAAPSPVMDPLRKAAQLVDDGWYAIEEGDNVRLRYASDLPARLNALRAELGEQPQNQEEKLLRETIFDIDHMSMEDD